MPPKKGKAKSTTAVGAKEAELAREVEQMRFEKERERVRNEELMLRQRLEEEEHKLLEDLRVRGVEVSNAIAERDRQANYLAREKELTALLDQRERDAQELRAKVLGLQQAQIFLENEKESAVRRSTMLAGELEAAQQKLAEAQEKAWTANAEHQEAQAALQAEYDALHDEVVKVRGQHEDATAELHKLRDQVQTLEAKLADEGKDLMESDGSVENITQLNPRSSDAESAVLLNVLHAAVEKYKGMAASLQDDLDRKVRDEEKSSLLMAVLNTQLDAVREDNKRLHNKAAKSREEVEAVRALIETERTRYRTLLEEMDRASSESAVTERQLQLEVGVHRKQVEELTGRLEVLDEAHKRLQSEFAELSHKSVQREQDDFRTNVDMKSELDKQKHELARLVKEKQDVEDEAFHYKILTRAEMDGLKTRMQKFQEALEQKEREGYEAVHVLRAEANRAETEHQREASSLRLEVSRLTEDLAAARSERDRIAGELEEKQATFTNTEKDLYEKLIHMTACHDAKRKEARRLSERLAEKEETYTNNSIFLNAEKENLRFRVEELLADAQKQRAEHLEHVGRITTELAELQSRMTAEVTEQDARCRQEKSRAELAERNVKRLLDQVRETKASARTAELNGEDVVRALKNEARELRSELGIAKRTIERLEGAFGDQTGYNQLKELNERLGKDVEGYRAQVAHLNSVVAAMKTEQDVMGGYKLQKANEEVARLSRSVQQLERMQKLTLPLFRELRAMAERAGVSTNLRHSLDTFDRHVNSIKSSTTAIAAAAVAPATVPADQETGGSVFVDAAGDVVSKQDMNSTLPAILHPRPPSGSRGASRIMEAFFGRKALCSDGGHVSSTIPAAAVSNDQQHNLVS